MSSPFRLADTKLTEEDNNNHGLDNNKAFSLLVFHCSTNKPLYLIANSLLREPGVPKREAGGWRGFMTEKACDLSNPCVASI